jgi:hypothetical protein
MTRSVAVGSAVLALGTFVGVGASGGAKPKLSPEDVERIDSVVSRLDSCATTKAEREIVGEIRLRCEGMCFLCGEPRVWRRSLEALKRRHSVSMIALGLGSEVIDQRVEAARALGRLGDRSAVPCLLEALRANNFIQEGSEIATVHEIYKEELVRVLSELTGQRFAVGNYVTTRQIEDVISAVELWLRRQATQPAPREASR